MAIESKGIFTKIDNMLTIPLTKAMDSTTTHHYCALATQLKKLCALYNIFMATLCLRSRFIITGYKKPEHSRI
ncbi:hypothetical protein ME7_01522 [Bartonella birtlesii LL-WM9]|uniref:Uncharacterized protein n=1 Tax=Bartonella birtlesii LL-WM9 TaxID=1094552 RepID=J0PP50_9HYPH|nr:hypothetical protein [Bartonella birtlesii]EJF74246.1 hypothetical protein ME7_01522 [Bartonella birtlesii LL-WM9]